MTNKNAINDVIISNDEKKVTKQLNYEKAMDSKNREDCDTVEALKEAGLKETEIKELLGVDSLPSHDWDNWNASIIERLEETLSLMKSTQFKGLEPELQNRMLRMKCFVTVEQRNKEIEEEDKTK